MAHFLLLKNYRRGRKRTYFSKNELAQLLQLYSQNVSNGTWRDYAIDHDIGMAVFSVFRASHEVPLYAVAKFPEIGNSPPDYALFDSQKRLYRSSNLADLLQKLATRPALLVCS